MDFDPCPHKIVQVILKAGRVIRELKGLPVEKNITTLYNETALMLGIVPVQMYSSTADHLPAPSEIKGSDGRFIVPRKDCPFCDGVMVLAPICPSCKDAEGGKYKSGYKCESCHKIDDKNEMFFSQRLSSMGIEIPTGSKQSLGIKTSTDDGLK